MTIPERAEVSITDGVVYRGRDWKLAIAVMRAWVEAKAPYANTSLARVRTQGKDVGPFWPNGVSPSAKSAQDAPT